MTFEEAMAELVRGWECGESPRVELLLGMLRGSDPVDAVELIYAEFCLAEEAGAAPDPSACLRRFPGHDAALRTLFGLHGALSSTRLRAASDLARGKSGPSMPEAGDAIGPYRLLRELGRGGFARVFLAEQADLDDRLVVVKVSARATPEARLMARTRHPHIAEVLGCHAVAGGAWQLICMPFLGGAALSEVLRARRDAGSPPRSGRDFLADLDCVSAPEYAPATTADARPARAALAAMSHAEAAAWVVARLAEALEHARRLGVTHGDLKPSNVLITAEGQPMLLDFNLAVDTLPTGPAGPCDARGTLAYMAPEQLDAASRDDAPAPSAADRHRSDIYALGLVLREFLTGLAPEVPAARGREPRALAAELARSRSGGGPGVAGRAGAAIPPGLRAIAAKCLAPEPVDRYVHAGGLAEDLDLWRAGRSLRHARQPRMRPGLARWTRRRRSAALVAASSLALALAASALTLRVSGEGRRDLALAKYSAILDRAEGRAIRTSSRLLRFGFWRPHDWEVPPREDPVTLPERHLAHYDVLSRPVDWASRDDVRNLPEAERDELRAWVAEQLLRLARALGDRPDSPADWRRALSWLEPAAASTGQAPLLAEVGRLRGRLGLPGGEASAKPAEAWLEAYLMGVASEMRVFEASGHADEARGHYRRALAGRPHLLWAHYRLASVSSRLRDWPEAVRHLRACLERRPDNPMLHALLASGLMYLKEYPPAMDEVARALALDPDLKAAYEVRAHLRAALGQSEALEGDLGRRRLLSRYDDPMIDRRLFLQLGAGPAVGASAVAGREGQAVRALLEAGDDDADTRLWHAQTLHEAGRDEAALAECERVLAARPEHLSAQFHRARRLMDLGRPEAAAAILAVVEDPRLDLLAAHEPSAIMLFANAAHDLLRSSAYEHAHELAGRGMAAADRHGSCRGEMHFLLAQTSARLSRRGPEARADALDHLRRARDEKVANLEARIARDPCLAGLGGPVLK